MGNTQPSSCKKDQESFANIFGRRGYWMLNPGKKNKGAFSLAKVEREVRIGGP